jgi:hypothetical protein
MTARKSRWAKSAFASLASFFGSSRRKQPYRRRLLLEPLEDRCVPTTITPTTFADGLGNDSLRDAVLQFNADPGAGDDTVQLLAGTYALTIVNTGGHHETAGLEGDLNITSTSHRLIVQGAGPSTIIDATQLQDRVFQIVNPGIQVVFQDLVIRGGLAQDDGSDGAMAGTTDALGGGILNNGGNITLDQVVITNNVARGGDVAVLTAPGHNASGGGIYSTGGALTIAGATIANNQALGGHGGDDNGFWIYAGDGGSAAGAGLYATGGSLDISDSVIATNQAIGGRGGDGSHSNSSGTGNGGGGGLGQGGGLYVNGSSLTVATSTIASNQGTGGSGGLYGNGNYGQGGGLYNSGMLTVNNSTLSGNSASGLDLYGGGGGGIYNSSGTLTVTDTTLAGNSATTSAGGGIHDGASGRLTVSNSTLFGNSATAAGGIYNDATLTVSNSTLFGNSAYYGGGIFNYYYGTYYGTLTVSNSSLSGNSAVFYGGGIYNDATLSVSNSTLSGNSAGFDAGGIYTYSTGTVTLTNVTLTASRANTSGSSYHGGGLFVAFGSPVLHNTLIAGNFRGATGTTDDDVAGGLDPSGDYNLIGDGTGMTGLSNGVNGNLVGSAAVPIDPLLGPLQDNGGPTMTHALLIGSPAIDAGNNAYATDWDQRGEGFPRIVNGIIDIGAFEYQDGGRGPGRTLPPRGKPIHLDAPALLSSALSPSRASFSSPSPANSPTECTLPGQAVAVVDRFFASLKQGDDADFALVPMRHHAQGKTDSWLPPGLKPVNVDTLHSFIGEEISWDAI